MRYNDAWFPMTAEESDASPAARFERQQDTGEGCADPALCGRPDGPDCVDPLLCRDVWRLAICV